MDVFMIQLVSPPVLMVLSYKVQAPVFVVCKSCRLQFLRRSQNN